MKYRIQRSPVHGLGLFACREIKKGESLGVFEGVDLDVESRERAELEMLDSIHVIRVVDDSGATIRARLGTGPLRFINHRPPGARRNCDMDWDSWEFFATRRIPEGREIFWDYGPGW